LRKKKKRGRVELGEDKDTAAERGSTRVGREKRLLRLRWSTKRKINARGTRERNT
jgi:hypothetical protein